MRKSPREIVETDVVIYPMNIDEVHEDDASKTTKNPKTENVNSNIIENPSKLIARRVVKRF